jgi:hypothetical protein
VPTILAALDGRGIAVESVTMHRPSLDDVYLHYTGRDFRAEDEAGGGGEGSESRGRSHVVHGRAAGAQPDARADLDRPAARPADDLAVALRQLFKRVTHLPGGGFGTTS